MNTSPRDHAGASTVGSLIMLLVVAYGLFVGIQYLRQQWEVWTVDSILRSLRNSQRVNPATSAAEVWSRIDNELNVNQMNDLKPSFSVTGTGPEFFVYVSFDRELNLLYDRKAVHYRRSMPLD